MAKNYIQFQNVSKSYGSGNAKTYALSDASFDINKGEFCILLGESGAGKTTLLNLLGGMDTVSGGKIKFNGTEISSLGKRDLKIGRAHV